GHRGVHVPCRIDNYRQRWCVNCMACQSVGTPRFPLATFTRDHEHWRLWQPSIEKRRCGRRTGINCGVIAMYAQIPLELALGARPQERPVAQRNRIEAVLLKKLSRVDSCAASRSAHCQIKSHRVPNPWDVVLVVNNRKQV